MAQARFEVSNLAGGHLHVGAMGRWQDFTQVNYFGIGSSSSEDAHSQYRIKDTDVVGYALFNANRWLTVGGTWGGGVRLPFAPIDAGAGRHRP